MNEAARALRYEDAARLRDQLRAIDRSLEKQKVASTEAIDQDVFGYHREADRLLVYVLHASRRLALPLRPGFVAFFAFSFAVTGGTLWEIFEFAVDEILGQSMQRGGLSDTMWDLIADTVAAAAISIFGWWYLLRPERSFIERWVEKFIRRNPRMFRERSE